MTDGSAEEKTTVDANNPKPGFFARIRSWMSGGGKGAAVEEGALIVNKDFISQVLPHRGRMLLLDRVVITPSKVAGFFTVTEEVCAGHAIGNNAVFRGVELPEMANQLLGIWYAIQHPELIGAGKIIFAREGKYEAKSFVQPGDLVQIAVPYDNLSGIMKTSHHGTLLTLSGKDFVFTVKGKVVGHVEEVVLKSMEDPKTTPPAVIAS